MPARTVVAIVCFLASVAVRSLADSGGPYEFVPDLQPDEEQPTCKVPEFEAGLGYYVMHEPDLQWDKKVGEPTSFGWKPLEGVVASIDLLGQLNGPIYAIRYIPFQSLSAGHTRAHGILIVAPSKHSKFRPVYYTTGGVTEDFTASKVKEVGSRFYYTVVTHHSGTGRNRHEVNITRDETFAFRRCEVMGKADHVWKELERQGYEAWHRGHWYDEERRAGFHHIYRDPKKHPGNESSHSWVRIDYEVRGDKFEVKGWEFIESPP